MESCLHCHGAGVVFCELTILRSLSLLLLHHGTGALQLDGQPCERGCGAVQPLQRWETKTPLVHTRLLSSDYHGLVPPLDPAHRSLRHRLCPEQRRWQVL